jgi:hypothetical protein
MYNYTFSIDEHGAVWFFDGVNPEPFMWQPNWPDGTEWADGEAEAWAKQTILALTDPDADYAGDNPANPTKPRVVPEDDSEGAE